MLFKMFAFFMLLIMLTNALKPKLTFKKYVRSMNIRNTQEIDNLYYCSSHSNTKPINWFLRHKKCYNFEQTETDFITSSNLCSKIPYAAINHLMHKNEFDVLKKDINFYKLYSTTLNRTYFQIWLADNEYADHFCSNKSFAPLIKFDNSTCQTGCFDCAQRTRTKAFYVCVKNCDWKVPFNSYCNTMNMSAIYLDKNLYYQGNEQLYICQGQLKCINNSCLCENKKKFINKLYCV